ncbi:MAG: toprim domain-containing protein, partial [Bacteriovoracaceae bacterium]|nr:toprim domain-containing protein [Bacteriovoracaceae bacterium]
FQKAKYKNSRESFIFNNKATLYAYHLANSEIRRRDQVLIFEGYMDAIALHQAGFTNTIAVMGTALNENTIRYLKNLTSNFVLSLDSDQAGMSAMQRINAHCLTEKINPLYLSYAPHKDADEFIRQSGAVELQARIKQAPPFLDIQLAQLLPPQRLATTDQKLGVLQKMFSVVAPLQNTLPATERLIALAQKLGLKSDSTTITTAYTNFLAAADKVTPTLLPVAAPSVASRPKASEDTASPAAAPAFTDLDQMATPGPAEVAITKTEQALMRVLLMHPQCFTHRNIDDLLDFVEHHEVKKYLTAIKQMALELDHHDYVRYLQEAVNDAQRPLAIREATGAALYHLGQEPLKDELIDRLLDDLKKQLQGDALKQTRQKLKLRQQNCTSEEELNQILSALVRVDQELQALKL